MLKVVAKCTVSEGKHNEFMTVAKELIEATVKEKGCIKYELFQDTSNPAILTIIEEWENKEVLDIHMNSAHFQKLVPLLAKLVSKDIELNVYSKLV